MDESLHLIARAHDHVARAAMLLASGDDAVWAGPSAAAYRARLEERRAECAALRDRVEDSLTALAARSAA